MGELDGTAFGIADAAAVVREIDRDLAERSSAAAEAVRKGRINQVEADYVATLIGDIREDLLGAFGALGEGEIRDSYARAWTSPISWHDKVRWLRGELEQRRKSYPELVAKGRLTEADARTRIRAIKALCFLYWDKMFQWIPPEGPAREYIRELRAAARLPIGKAIGKAVRRELYNSDAANLYRELVRRHLAEVEAANGHTQGELAA